MVIIDGDSSPVFDHIHVKDAHCGFHMVGGSARITHSVFERLVYGIMAYATAPVIEDSVFRDNANDVGTCLGATAEQAPALEHNHYLGRCHGPTPPGRHSQTADLRLCTQIIAVHVSHDAIGRYAVQR